jgi:hypothetical protein
MVKSEPAFNVRSRKDPHAPKRNKQAKTRLDFSSVESRPPPRGRIPQFNSTVNTTTTREAGASREGMRRKIKLRLAKEEKD